MGYGVTGRAAVQYVLSCGGSPLVSDSRSEAEFAGAAVELDSLGIEWEAGGHSLNFLLRADLVLLSPGISSHEPVVELLRGRGIPVYGELAILAPILRDRKTTVVAVTGSNGKTTVTSLIGEVLQKAGRRAFIGGNIGVSLYEYCRRGEDAADVVVAEVSSFQLECAGEFAPDIGVLLNISSDHLDRHGSMENYISAKMALFHWQSGEQIAVINGDDPACWELSDTFRGRCLSFGRSLINDAIIEDETLTLVEGDEKMTLPLPPGTAGFAAENFAAAALVLRSFGIGVDILATFFAEFVRPPHRLEYVDEIGDVLYLNDSKATNTGAVLGALRQQSRSVLLIAGGRGKGEDYGQLRSEVEKRVRVVIVIGEAAEDIADALKGSAQIHRVPSLEAAVLLAGELAVAGETVLLSPACASFDMFSGYCERGECFRNSVALLAEKKRVV